MKTSQEYQDSIFNNISTFFAVVSEFFCVCSGQVLFVSRPDKKMFLDWITRSQLSTDTAVTLEFASRRLGEETTKFKFLKAVGSTLPETIKSIEIRSFIFNHSDVCPEIFPIAFQVIINGPHETRTSNFFFLNTELNVFEFLSDIPAENTGATPDAMEETKSPVVDDWEEVMRMTIM